MEKQQISNIDDYIALQTPVMQEKLIQLREIIRKIIPAEAQEVISYQMPAIKYHGILLYYAAFKNHYSLMAMPTVNIVFKDKLKDYQISKGTIRFSPDKPIPESLIIEIVKFRVKENLEKKHLKNFSPF